MLYDGPNGEGFARDARLWNEQFHGFDQDVTSMRNEATDAAWQLADDYGIERSDIWDYLPEYAA